MMILGHDIYASTLLTKTEVVERPWRERLFSWPWRPWRSTKVVRVPDMDAMLCLNGKIFMHPARIEQLKRSVRDAV